MKKLLSDIQLDLNVFPEAVQFLINLIGEEGTFSLIQHYGGSTLRIPRGDTIVGRTKIDLLAQKIGKQEIQNIVQTFGGTCIYIPNCKKLLTAKQHAKIIQDRDKLAAKGISERQLVSDLARRYKLSDRHIWRILKKSYTIPAVFKNC